MRLSAVTFFCLLASCAPTVSNERPRKLLAKSEQDYSSLWDSNNDGKADIERWYRGSAIVFEKYDLDFDGYWDVQVRKHYDGSFDKTHDYPEGKYPVATHHIFYASPSHTVDVTTLARIKN